MIEIDALTMILFVLSDGQSKHGYSVGGKIASITNGDIKLSTGTLYRALSELAERGYIEEVENDSVDERRRCYQITSDGAQQLRRAIGTLRSVLAFADKQSK